MSLMLLDSASLYFRAFFGVPDSLRSPGGLPVNAVRGLLDTIAWLATTRGPDRMVACWDDDWRPAFRVAAIPSYKAHRVAQEVPGTTGVEEVPESLLAQVPVIVEMLAALGIARVGVPGYEADDIIGTLATRAVAQGAGPVDIVTGDRDLFQLVDDAAGVRVLYPARGIRDPDVVNQKRLAERYGVTSGQAYADMATLRGDPSDGLPGVPGVGEKTAAKLLARYGTLNRILAARDAGDQGLTSTQRRRLQEADDYLRVAPIVVQVARNAPLPLFDPTVPTEPADPDALEALTTRWGLGSSVDRVRSAFGWA